MSLKNVTVLIDINFRYHQHQASIKNKGIPIHHMTATHFKQTNPISIHHIAFVLCSFSFVIFLFFVPDSFDFTIWVTCLIATFNCFYIW